MLESWDAKFRSMCVAGRFILDRLMSTHRDQLELYMAVCGIFLYKIASEGFYGGILLNMITVCTQIK